MYNKYILDITRYYTCYTYTYRHVICFLILKSNNGYPVQICLIRDRYGTFAPTRPHLSRLGPTYAVLRPGWRQRPLWQDPGGLGNCCASWLLPVKVGAGGIFVAEVQHVAIESNSAHSPNDSILLLEEKTVTYQKGTPKRVFTILSSPRLV